MTPEEQAYEDMCAEQSARGLKEDMEQEDGFKKYKTGPVDISWIPIGPPEEIGQRTCQSRANVPLHRAG